MAGAQNVRDLLLQRWGVPLTTESLPVATAVPVTAVTVLRQKPTRIGFIVINLGAGTVFFAPASMGTEVSSTFGLRLEANGGGVIANWEQDGEMTGWEWRAIGAAASTVAVFEVVIEAGRVQVRPVAPGGAT